MAYTLTTSYTGRALLDGFDFFHARDPSNGFVAYQARAAAEAADIFSVDRATGAVRLGVDHTNVVVKGRRPSLRLESRAEYDHGLFIGGFGHMPASQCGVWPAFWAYGPDWPNNGEIDIIEGANTAQKNIMSAHTSPGCILSSSSSSTTGTLQESNCGPHDFNVGCTYTSPLPKPSYGDQFNARGGGVYAMEWTSSLIRVWHFPRDRIPADIGRKRPSPGAWGKPDAAFGGDGCSVDRYFHRMQLVLNVNFCGHYGSATWGRGDGGGCAAAKNGASCEEYVARNPGAFKDAYWEVNYIDAYQMVGTNVKAVVVEESSGGGGDVNIRPVVPIESPTPTDATDATDATDTTDTTTTDYDDSPSTADDDSPPLANVARIGNYSLLGCFRSSHHGFPDFDLLGSNSTAMTPQQCVAVFDDDVAALANPFECNVPCPGDPTLACGGQAWIDADELPSSPSPPCLSDPDTDPDPNDPIPFGPLSRRVMATDTLLTIYIFAPAVPILAAPGLGGPAGVETITATSTVTYTPACSSHSAVQLFETSCVLTVTAECTFGETPAVPMTTQVVDCDGCGPMGEDTVTLTMPVEILARVESPTSEPTVSVV